MIDYKLYSEKVEQCIAEIHKAWKPLFKDISPNSKRKKRQIRTKQIEIMELYAEEFNIDLGAIIKIIGF